MTKKRNVGSIVYLTEEEQKILKEVRKKILVEEDKMVSMSEVIRRAIYEVYVNGNRPPPEKPYSAVSKPLQDSVIESPEKPSTEPSIKESNGYFNGINLDF